MKIALGTISKNKIAFLNMVCQELDFQCEIIPVEVSSGVSDQPITSDETRSGSINRAKEALEKIGDADIGFGIEVGYEKINDVYNILCWASAAINNEMISCCSAPFPLPKFHDDILKKGLQLGENLDGFIDISDGQDHLRLANDLISREPYIIDAVGQLVKKIMN